MNALLARRLRIVALDLWRTFFRGPVRANLIRARGGGIAGASTVALGLLAFVVAAAGVVFADRIGATPIADGVATLGRASTPGNPVGIPVLLYPALVALLLIAVFVGAFGAIYAPRVTAVLAVAVMWLPVLLLAGFAWSFRDIAWPAWLGLPGAAILPIGVWSTRRLRPRPAVAQAVACVLSILAVVPSVVGQTLAYTQPGQAGGPALLGASIEQAVTLLAALTAPVAVLAGAGAISFGRTVTDFLARSVRRLTGRRVAAYALIVAVLLAWRLLATIDAIAGAESPWRLLVRTVLAAALCVAAVRWWAWATRGFGESAEEVERGAAHGGTPVALLAVLFVFPSMIVLVLAAMEVAVLGSHHLLTVGTRLGQWVGHASVGAGWNAILGPVLMAAAAIAARRRPSVAAAWVGVAGAVLLVTAAWNTALPDPVWGALTGLDYARVALLVTVVAAAIRVRAYVRARVWPEQQWLATAFTVLALTGLVSQGGFLEDPFRLLLGFTGIGLVFFGVVWGFLTSGAHASSTGLPGLGRTAVYLAYAVLTTTLLAWGYATGVDANRGLTGIFAAVGANVLGVALLLSLLAVWLPELLRPTVPVAVVPVAVVPGAGVPGAGVPGAGASVGGASVADAPSPDAPSPNAPSADGPPSDGPSAARRAR